MDNKNDIENWSDWHCRMPDVRDQQKAIKLFAKSGASSKSNFMRAQILNEDFRVLHTDLGSMRFSQEITQLVAAINRIGVLYNQTVKSINMYHTEAVAQRLLKKSNNSQKEILAVLNKILKLVEVMKNDGQNHNPEKSTQ